jgi:hypothetical protein
MAVTRSRHGDQKTMEQTKLPIKRKAKSFDDKVARVKRHKTEGAHYQYHSCAALHGLESGVVHGSSAMTGTQALPEPQRQPSGKRTLDHKPAKTLGAAKTKDAPKPANGDPEVHEVTVNRAPVLTAWVAEVAKRQG